MALLVVAVKPKCKHAALAIDGETIEICVTAAPHDGEANDAVRRLLARALRMPLRAVTLVRGANARQKAFAVEDIERTEAFERLRAFTTAKERVV